MGKILQMLILLLALSATAESFNALKPEAKVVANLQLTKNGKAIYNIVTGKNPDAKTRKAASILSKCLKKITKIDFETVVEGKEKGIYLFTDPKLAEEEYQIKYNKGNIELSGGSRRGPIYAALAFAEEDLGCRYYKDRWTTPVNKNLAVDIVPRKFNPQLVLRDPYMLDAFNPRWSLYNRTNSSHVKARIPAKFGGSQYYARSWFVHTFGRVIPAKKYFREHPEYFSMINGKRVSKESPDCYTQTQLCLTNPDVKKIFLAAARKALKKNPNARYLSVSQNDVRGKYCRCPECEEINKTDGPSGNVMRFVNYIAENLKEDHPHVFVSYLAYHDTIKAPQQTKPADNVLIVLCNTYTLGHLYAEADKNPVFAGIIKDWSAIGAKFYIWDYTTNFKDYFEINPNIRMMEKNTEYYVKNGAVAMMHQGNYQSPGTSEGAMKAWVLAKKDWNPKLQTKDLVKDFILGYYGSAAGGILEYQALLDKAYESRKNQQVNIDSAFIKKAIAILEKSEKTAKSVKLKKKIRRLKFNVLYEKIKRKTKYKDLKAFAEDVKEFKAMLKEFQIIRSREGRNSVLKSLASLLESKIVLPETPGTIFSDEQYVRTSSGGKVIKDSNALNGYAVQQVGKNWSLQWWFPAGSFKKGQYYQMRMRIKADKIGNKGLAAQAGIYNFKKKKVSFRKIFKASELSRDYKYYKIGRPFIPDPSNMFFIYIAPKVNIKNIKSISTDRLELVPVKK